MSAVKIAGTGSYVPTRVVTNEEIAPQLKEQLLSEKQQKAFTSKINQLKILFPVDIF